MYKIKLAIKRIRAEKMGSATKQQEHIEKKKMANIKMHETHSAQCEFCEKKKSISHDIIRYSFDADRVCVAHFYIKNRHRTTIFTDNR